jgi:restriction endonuclease
MSGFVESVPNMKQRINQLQTQQTAQLEKLYARQAAQYLEDALDRYAAQDDEADSGYSDDINVCHSQYLRTSTG